MQRVYRERTEDGPERRFGRCSGLSMTTCLYRRIAGTERVVTMRVAILTISDSVSRGSREDRSGAAIADRCRELGWAVASRGLLADEEDQIAARLGELADSGAVDLIVTVGGTGLGPRDVTPEATVRAAPRLAPGFGERMRAAGSRTSLRSILSRGQAACRGATLILNLPGSPRGAVESLDAVAEVVPHAIEILRGAGHDKPPKSGGGGPARPGE